MPWKFGSSQFGKIVSNATMNFIVLNIWILMHVYIIFCIHTYCLSLSHYNKSPQTGWLEQWASISHSSESWEVQVQCLVRAHVLVCQWPSSCCVLRAESRGSKLLPVSLLTKVTNPIMRISPSWPYYFPKDPHSNTIAFGLGHEHMIFRGKQICSP